MAAYNGHRFEAVLAKISGGRDNNYWFIDPGHGKVAVEQEMVVHHPVDPRMTYADVEGATVAYPNAAGTAWLFAHCDADFHHDMEVRIEADIVSLFQPGLDKRMALALGVRDTLQTAAIGKWGALVAFRDAVVAHAIAEARKVHIGWYHQNPHDSHLHSRIEAAIDATVAHYNVTPALKYSVVSEDVEPIRTRLSTLHSYETRWDMAARVAAERKAREASEAGD
ncbi:MAG: hypothetical protein OXC14_04000 [Rhodospirillaceae bacterium]|nr:hypothetical protein [Rhodospirillaceae bacterium]